MIKLKPEVVKIIILSIQVLLALALNIVMYFMYKSCYDSEVAAFAQLNGTLNSICVKHYEISEPVKEYLFWSYLPQFSDKMMMFMGPLAFKLYQDPFGIIYNYLIYVLLANRQEMLVGNLTFCGNPIQDKIKKFPMHLNDAAATHFTIMILTAAVVIFNICWNLVEWIVECIQKLRAKKKAKQAAAAPPPSPSGSKKSATPPPAAAAPPAKGAPPAPPPAKGAPAAPPAKK